MNGYTLDRPTLLRNLDFVREELVRIKTIRVQLKVRADARSDDAITLLKAYDHIIRELNYLLQYSYDADY